MNEDNKKDVFGDFIKDLAKEFGSENKKESLNKNLNNVYIDCCLNSIKQWDDKEYWKRINENSKKLLDLDLNGLYGKYYIRGSYEKSNDIYKAIYNGKNFAGNDYHGFLLFKILKNISEEEAKKTLNDEYFRDYRISHVWGCTKNIYLNNLPFNFFAIPSFCYCLSDKNNGGEIGKNFRLKLKKQVIKNCYESIKLYNQKMVDLVPTFLKNLNNYICSIKDDKNLSQRLSYIMEQFILIPIVISNKDEKEWNLRIEEGLKIFTYDLTRRNNIVMLSDDYKKAKDNKFKCFID